MLKAERKRFILNEVRIHNRVLLTDIAETLNVSVDTIRRDITELHKERMLKKVHGGAISLGFDTIHIGRTDIYALESKTKIAQKGISLLKMGQVILLSGGTTNMEFARLIPVELQITCFTPSLPVANQLMSKPNVDLIFIGGKMAKNSQIAIGGDAINMLSDIRVDMCFLGTNSIDTQHGLTEFDWEIVQLKKAMVKASKKIVCPVISEKLNTVQRYKVCDIDRVDILLTELNPKDTRLDPFRDRHIEVL